MIRKILKFLCLISITAAMLILLLSSCTIWINKTEQKQEEEQYQGDLKPVIYLYTEQETEVTVKLDYSGTLTATYPEYNDGWTVTAQPDGTLTDSSGKSYNYLFWEGKTNTEYDFSKGFCVAGEDTAEFLENALSQLGLTRREANEFIVFWLPRMQENEYNLIAFQDKAYTDSAVLDISPQPDSVLRVFMAWKSLDKAVDIEPQEFDSFQRSGFTVVEWGGCEVK